MHESPASILSWHHAGVHPCWTHHLFPATQSHLLAEAGPSEAPPRIGTPAWDEGAIGKAPLAHITAISAATALGVEFRGDTYQGSVGQEGTCVYAVRPNLSDEDS